MTERRLTINGSRGEGGGQILRSSLALSLVTGTPFLMNDIRARRKKPGLMRQHLTAVRAAAEVGQARVKGASLGSQRLTFEPGKVQPGDYRFDVGTAGSATLVLETVLPALLVADGESNLTLEGGTHNPMAPPFDFLAKAYLPLVNRLGPIVEARLVRPGFYPAGGGRMAVRIGPARDFRSLELIERGEIAARRVRALVANLPRHIAERECATIAQVTGWDAACFAVEEVKGSRGPGNVVMIELDTANVTEVFTAFGQLGVRAEDVALGAIREAQKYLAADVPVGSYLADQLLLPLAMGAFLGTGGGAFRTVKLTLHSTTHMEIIRDFLGIDVEINEESDTDCLVRVRSKKATD